MNDWLAFEDHERNSISDAVIVAVRYGRAQPRHQPSQLHCRGTDEEGEYELNDVNFNMPGSWEVTFTVTVNGGADGGAFSEDAMMELTVIN